LEQLVALKRRYYLESTQNISPQEGVYKILNFLGDRGIPLAVVTGTEREAAKRIVEHWFPKYFKVLITGSDVLAGKPNPEPYNMAIKQLGIGKSNHCIVIENAPHGVRSARDADLIVFGLLVGSPLTPGDLNKAGASRVFSGFEELQQAIGMLRYSDTLKK
jgi:HAD superfamily hydrolase (TIGR01509 family)